MKQAKKGEYSILGVRPIFAASFLAAALLGWFYFYAPNMSPDNFRAASALTAKTIVQDKDGNLVSVSGLKLSYPNSKIVGYVHDPAQVWFFLDASRKFVPKFHLTLAERDYQGSDDKLYLMRSGLWGLFTRFSDELPVSYFAIDASLPARVSIGEMKKLQQVFYRWLAGGAVRKNFPTFAEAPVSEEARAMLALHIAKRPLRFMAVPRSYSWGLVPTTWGGKAVSITVNADILECETVE